MRPEPSGRYLRELLQVPFTDEQLAVVAAPPVPQLVVAGAGSGKTSVMAARVVHAVAFHGVDAGAVLGLTFTNRAAAELSVRASASLARLAGRPGDDGGAEDGHPRKPGRSPGDATVSTYHAYAGRLLRDHAPRLGREPTSRLLSPAATWQLALAVVRGAAGPFEVLDWTPTTVARYLLALDAELADHLLEPAAVARFDANLRARAEADAAGRPTHAVQRLIRAAQARDALLGLVEAYRARKRDLDVIDFGDQVALAAKLVLRFPEVARRERDQFHLVLLDEYQDTGVAQRALLAALFGSGRAVTAVGDPHQAIYGWRGASTGNLRRFPEHFSSRAPGGQRACVSQFLGTNFRSGGRIVALANELVRPLRDPPSGREADLCAGRLADGPSAVRRTFADVPALHAARGHQGDVVVALHATAADEAEWVAEHLARAVQQERVAPGQVAVLCRRRGDFALLHPALVARGLPVEVVGLGGLLQMPEVADVVAVLEVLVEPSANPALLRLLSGPRWRIGPRDLAALGRRARELAAGGTGTGPCDRACSSDGARPSAAASAGTGAAEVAALIDAVEDPGPTESYSSLALERLRRLAAELAALRHLATAPVVEAVTEVVRRTGLDAEVAASPPALAAARSANLAALLDLAAAFQGASGEAHLAAFLGYLAAAREVEDGLDPGVVSASDTVKLLTVHRAKGLEWDVVAVPGLTADTFPSRQARPVWTRAAHVVPSPLRGDAAELPALSEVTKAGLEAFAGACHEEELREERRLAYVAMTRARRRLLVSGHHWAVARRRPSAVSPFLAEVRRVCEAGGGSVELWCAGPPALNPLQGATEDVAWPPPSSAPTVSLRAAAAAVRQALTRDAHSTASEIELPGCRRELSDEERAIAQRWSWETDLLLHELSRAAAPTREVRLPHSLTATQLVRLAEDPDGLARELARPMPCRPAPALRRGRQFHLWVRQFASVPPLVPAEALRGAVDDGVGERGGALSLPALQEAFAHSPYGAVRPVAVEQPFDLDVEGWRLRGRIDAVFAVDGGYEVIDYKTGLRRAREPAHALQLAVYRLAWAGMARVPSGLVTAAFLHVPTGQLVRPPGLPDLAGLARLLEGASASAGAGAYTWGRSQTGSSQPRHPGANGVVSSAPRVRT